MDGNHGMNYGIMLGGTMPKGKIEVIWISSTADF